MTQCSLRGYLAVSKAGRDKDSIYVIWDNDEEYVYLVDGKYKTIDSPKKKKKKHISVMSYRSDTVFEKINNNLNIYNEDIKLAIKIYKSVTNK